MKKYGLRFRIFLISSVSIILMAFWIIVFFTFSKPSIPPRHPNEKTQSNLKDLETLGFTRVKNLDLGDDYDIMVNMDKVKYYREKYGLRYLSETGLRKLLEEFDFVSGNPNDFVGVIPENSIEELKANLNKINGIKESANFYFNGSNNIIEPIIDIVEETNITPAGKALAIHNYNNPFPDPAWLGNCVYNDHYNNDPKYPRIPLILHYNPTPIINSSEVSLHVIAPQGLFDLKNKDIIDRIIKEAKVKDPMIIVKVQDGYVILSQW